MVYGNQGISLVRLEGKVRATILILRYKDVISNPDTTTVLFQVFCG